VLRARRWWRRITGQRRDARSEPSDSPRIIDI
jgi:hypothetical protein